MTFRSLLRWLLALLLATQQVACQTPPLPPSPMPRAHWQALARADLEAVRQTLQQAHPGTLDALNPGFGEWLRQGHAQALELVPEVDSYDALLAVLRYYVSGFEDGHLIYSDNERGDQWSQVTGWSVRQIRGAAMVVGVDPQWLGPLPKVGETLAGCDGMGVDELMRLRVAPYLDRRQMEAVQELNLSSLMWRTLARAELRECNFVRDDGSRYSLKVHYQAVPWERMAALGRAAMPSPRRRSNGYSLQDGVLWVQVASFSLNPDAAHALDEMLARLRQEQGAHTLVFDLRGNGGGDSGVGDRIFDAATGGLELDATGLDNLPRTHALWRVSDVALARARQTVQYRTELYGADHPSTGQSRSFAAALHAAQVAGRPWLEQPGGPLLTRAEVQRRGGHLKRFAGRVALLTDHRCASACLDFADTVRRVPGAVHLGRTTSADAVYIDVGTAPLPSGNVLVLPLKVWRNRVRGNNESLVPDQALRVDLQDDTAVRVAVLEALAARLR